MQEYQGHPKPLKDPPCSEPTPAGPNETATPLPRPAPRGWISPFYAIVLLLISVFASPWAIRFAVFYWVQVKVESFPYTDTVKLALDTIFGIANTMLVVAGVLLLSFLVIVLLCRNEVGYIWKKRWCHKTILILSPVLLALSVYSGLRYLGIIAGYQLAAEKTGHIPDFRHPFVSYSILSEAILLAAAFSVFVYVLIQILRTRKDGV